VGVFSRVLYPAVQLKYSLLNIVTKGYRKVMPLNKVQAIIRSEFMFGTVCVNFVVFAE
jgi:hypothetical protein